MNHFGIMEEEIEYYTDCHCLNKKIVISMKAVLDNNAKFERIWYNNSARAVIDRKGL